MNLIICGFGEKWHYPIIKNVIQYFEKPKTILISTINHPIEELCECKKYDFNDIAFCDYKSINFDDLLPIDMPLIKSLSVCENLYLQAQDRLEIKKGKKVPYEDRREFFYKDVRILNNIVEKENIDVCIFDYIPHLGFDYVLYELCKRKGIKVIMPCYGLSIPFKTTTMYFTDSIFDPIPELRKEYKEEETSLSDRMQAYFNYYCRDKSEIVSYVTVDSFKKQPPKIVKYMKSTKRMLSEHDRALVPAIKLRVKEPFRSRKNNKVIQKFAVPLGENDKFLYFPLHYQPECTSMPMGGYYCDQLLVIQMISSLLPNEVYLYIKPHPHTSLLATEEFYKKISKFRNVRFVSKDTNTYELTEKALAVVSLTGTVVWEALAKNKPALMFGYYFFEYAPGVFHIQTVQDCKNAINEILTGKVLVSKNRLRSFLAEFDKHLYDGYIDTAYNKVSQIGEETRIANLSRGYIEFYEKLLSKEKAGR